MPHLYNFIQVYYFLKLFNMEKYETNNSIYHKIILK